MSALTPESLDSLKVYLQLRVPEWMGREVQVFLTNNYLKETVEFCVYFTVHRSNWVMIGTSDTNDGPIDRWMNLRSDYEVTHEEFLKVDWLEINDKLWASVYAYWAEVVLCPGDGDSGDPVYHVTDRAILLPRDEVRQMIFTDIDFYAPRIDTYSSFREEDWYKEWESKSSTKSST